ncbi:pseudouridine-5'-phosphate glycosidase [Enterovibrio baiacu]|uniref:pseudouridine-5'-phosphate glycosidase n=1 Tax=Enterovibrio baiacu TaxID=2491023 RepID=UPI003D1013FB
MLNPYLDIHPDIERAIAEGKPVVALESTIISHGMPYPQNVETALRVEQKVRDSGAIPATIAILKGRLKVGLSEEEITYLGQQGQKAMKTSRRDIPFIIATKGDGATTVASTMILADMAGIRVFATGGIGGVHRGAETSLDISADLEELAQTNVAVVCAGIKSILDLGLTLEYLETKGVPVVGYQTNTLPAFYSRESAFNVDYRLDAPQQIADALKAKWAMSLAGGAIIANPIPAAHAMANEDIDHVIQSAIEEMDAQGIKGKASTPFLLAKVAEKTQGESLKANIALVLNNAELASKIAVAYCS